MGEPVNQHINDFLVVGGGTTGWMAAALLARTLLPGGARVTLIEAPEIGIIGVGEATLPSLGDLMRSLGVPEREWLPPSNGTHKLGIRFENWTGDPAWAPWFHPFFVDYHRTRSVKDRAPALSQTEDLMGAWLRRKPLAKKSPLVDQHFVGTHVAMARRSGVPMPGGGIDDVPTVAYAHHISSIDFGRYLKRYAMARGVVHIEGHVERVEVAEGGDVTAVLTADGRRLEAQFFLDCSGFRALLLNALGVERISWRNQLWCDRAAFCDGPRRTEEVNPFSTLRAMNAGWRWHIPIRNREAYGYVYSSSFLDQDGAEAEIRKDVDLPDEKTVRHLKFSSGRVDTAWVRNVLGCGLAAGFIEPLESTGIALTQYGIAQFLLHFRERRIDPDQQARYNRLTALRYDRARDFVLAHYVLSRRNDTPFWRANLEHGNVPDTLRTILAEWEEKGELPIDLIAPSKSIFALISWYCLLDGMNVPPGRHTWIQDDALDSVIAGHLAATMKRSEHALGSLPGHRAYLEAIAENA